MTRKEFFPVAIVIRTGKPILPGSSDLLAQFVAADSGSPCYKVRGSGTRGRGNTQIAKMVFEIQRSHGPTDIKKKSYFCLSATLETFMRSLAAAT
jgi:hypothetical protein